MYRADVGAAGNYTATASVSSALQPGTYYLRIDNVGYGDPLNTGYSTYGSRGAYTLGISPS